MEKQPCVSCNKNPVYVQKRKLCKRCYSSWYSSLTSPLIKSSTDKSNTPSRASAFESRSTRIPRLISKYGTDILERFIQVKTNPFSSLNDIAKEYGFCREYASQLFFMLFGFDYNNARREKQQRLKEECTLVCKHDPRNKVAIIQNKKSPQYVGSVAELMFMKKCESLGFEVKPCSERKYDLVVNGYNVEIKARLSSPLRTSKRSNRKYYSFNISKYQRGADVVALYVGEKKKWYIIPRKLMSRKTFSIPANESKYKNRKDPNWHLKYEESWHFLEPPARHV